MLATIALMAACSGDGEPDPTPTPSEFDITASYFRSLDDAVGAASDALNPEPISDGGEEPTPSVADAIDSLRELESELVALAPPAVAAEAHQRLLNATREIVAVAERNTGAAPDDATAEAQIAPVVAEFADACLDLAEVSQSADAPINIDCGGDDDGEISTEEPSDDPTAPPPPPTISPPTPEA